MPNVNLSVDLVNAVLQYLTNRPYGEVAGLIDAIRTQATTQPAADVVDAAAAGTD